MRRRSILKEFLTTTNVKKYIIHNNMRSIKFSIIIISLLITRTLFTQEYISPAGAFLNFGVGARALAMGSAFTSISEGTDAVYWNPASLSGCRRSQLSAMYSYPGYDQKHCYAAAVYPVRFVGTFGISWIGYSIPKPENFAENSSEPEEPLGNYQNALIVALGRKFVDFFSAGVSVKILHHSLDHYQGFGLGFDAGFLYSPGNRRLKAGIVFRNIRTLLNWKNNHNEIIPLMLHFGISFKLTKNLLISADVINEEKDLTDPYFGFEYRILGLFPLRFGMNNSHPSAGLGLKIYAEKANVTFDYGFAGKSPELPDVHRFSINLEFNHRLNVNKNR